jgi:hypothetical protein
LSGETRGDSFLIRGQYTDSGSTGIDRLEFRLDQNFRMEQMLDGVYWPGDRTWYPRSYTVDLTEATVSGFEVLSLTTATYFDASGVFVSYGPSAIYLTAAQLSGFRTLSGAAFAVRGGGTVDLGAIELRDGASLSLSGQQSYRILGTLGGEAITTYDGDDTILAGAGKDIISAGLGVDSIDAGEW